MITFPFVCSQNFTSSSQTVETADGRVFGYEKLCICSGGRPKLLTQDNPYVLGIRDTDSAQVRTADSRCLYGHVCTNVEEVMFGF